MKKFVVLIILVVISGIVIFWLGELDRESAANPEFSGNGSRLAELLGSDDIKGYSTALEPRAFRFPADHGPHPGFRNEWWYLTGNLDGEQGQRFGFELTFFRFALSPDVAGAVPRGAEPQPVSNWRTNQVFIAHFAVTDEKNQQFHVAQRFSRGALGLAGAQGSPFKVWVEDWSIRELQDQDETAAGTIQWELKASAQDFTLHLNLTSEKQPVLNGINGLSQKSATPGNASYYYSISRLRSKGTLQVAGQDHTVSGLSWLDREWSSSALDAGQQGWDWFALQLSDGSDLMFYNIRRNDGSQDEHSAGTWISPNGAVRHLSRDEVEIVVTGEWGSPEGGIYPSGWEIRVPGLDLTLKVMPLIEDQELFTTVRYWEGAVSVSGQRNQQVIKGRGYVELTGYAR
jgi:predicted secreted hydrolase